MPARLSKRTSTTENSPLSTEAPEFVRAKRFLSPRRKLRARRGGAAAWQAFGPRRTRASHSLTRCSVARHSPPRGRGSRYASLVAGTTIARSWRVRTLFGRPINVAWPWAGTFRRGSTPMRWDLMPLRASFYGPTRILAVATSTAFRSSRDGWMRQGRAPNKSMT